ncbi:MAG TPA: PASTA domain-containing protein [Clostridiales bacterium]|nr:PASTA domain-containing protein [Clostridiales bacterium]
MQNTSRLCMGCMNDNGGERVCPICGFDNEGPRNSSSLPLRFWLDGRYIVGKVLDSNGEGITYLGWDNQKDAVVKIREYFPVGLCERSVDGKVVIIPGCEFSYNDGIMAFLEMARTLERLKDLPTILPVYDIIEANNTGYFVSETVSGITLREFLLRNGGTLKWEQARSLFLPLLSTLKTLHNNNIIHRGISPETLFVGRDGKIRLTGFCTAAARTARSDMTAQLFPGFAAIEQYGFDGQQGPWTDVYGVAATIYRTLVGNPPPEATERVTNDNMTIPAEIVKQLPEHVLTALANALQILPEDRTRSIDEFRAELIQSTTGTMQIAKPKAAPAKRKQARGRNYAVMASLVTAGVLVVAVIVLAFTVFKDDLFGANKTSSGGLEPPPFTSLESRAVDTQNEKLNAVPDLVGMRFAQVLNNPDYKDIFKFEIVSKSYNDKYARGVVYEQYPAADTPVAKGTTISVRVSLGPSQVAVPNLKGLTFDEAYVKLIELGFLPENIQQTSMYDANAPKDVVVNVEPAAGQKVSPDSMITVFVNTLKADDTPSSQPSGPSSKPSSTTTSQGESSSVPPSSSGSSSKPSSSPPSSSEPEDNSEENDSSSKSNNNKKTNQNQDRDDD